MQLKRQNILMKEDHLNQGKGDRRRDEPQYIEIPDFYDRRKTNRMNGEAVVLSTCYVLYLQPVQITKYCQECNITKGCVKIV